MISLVGIIMVDMGADDLWICNWYKLLEDLVIHEEDLQTRGLKQQSIGQSSAYLPRLPPRNYCNHA